MNGRAIITRIADFVANPIGDAAEHSSYERFAIPYKFQPRLRVIDAAKFALRTFLRILLGSVLFGAWGAYTLLAWVSIRNPFLRVGAEIPLLGLFLALLVAMMMATGGLLRTRRP